jgi:hypothetical protein
MFENSLFPASPSSRLRGRWLKRAISLVVSLAIHAAALVLLVVFYTPLKILDFENYIRDVYIGPPLERLYMPRFEAASDPPEGLGEDAVLLAAVSGLERPTAPDESPSQTELILPERIEAPLHLREKLELRRPPELRSELPPGLSFQLAPDRDPPRYSYQPDPESGTAPLGVRGLILPSLPRYSSEGATDPDRVLGTMRPADNAAASRLIDIGNWADRAVALIMENWLVPHLMLDQEEDEFEISLVIQKDGWIASTEVVTPARIPALQMAALKALEVSSPLPRLPLDFRQESLEILLVFSRK